MKTSQGEKRFSEKGAELMRNINIAATIGSAVIWLATPFAAAGEALTIVNGLQTGFWEGVRRHFKNKELGAAALKGASAV